MADEGAAEAPRLCAKLPAEDGDHEDSGDDSTPTTRTESECSDVGHDDDWESEGDAAEKVPQLGPGLFPAEPQEEGDAEEELGPGLFLAQPPGEVPPTAGAEEAAPAGAPDVKAAPAQEPAQVSVEQPGSAPFTREETLFIFDWDDTLLPSTWVQRQGMRLGPAFRVNSEQREQLAMAAAAASETLRLAKLAGTVVLVTNAERGWIELSCQKFMPALLPLLEGVRTVSARTLYEGPACPAPLDWKVRAFEMEIARACGPGGLRDPTRRKNIHSFGDSTSEREALLRTAAGAPNCRAKVVKFVDHPDIAQLLKQHALVSRSLDRIAQHDDNLDLSIDCS